jgi:hypothetical protein
VGLPAADEAAGLVGVEPGPDRVGVVAGAHRGQQPLGGLQLQAQQGGVAGGPLGLVALGLRRVAQRPADDRAPEPLDLGQVPDQVGGIPVGA